MLGRVKRQVLAMLASLRVAPFPPSSGTFDPACARRSPDLSGRRASQKVGIPASGAGRTKGIEENSSIWLTFRQAGDLHHLAAGYNEARLA